MTLTSNTTPAMFYRLLLAALCPAVAFAVMITTAPAAYALTEQQIQDSCKATGGTYRSIINPDGTRVSSCCTKDSWGKTHCDYFVNGQYDSTTVSNETGTPAGPTEQPVQPPPGTAPAAPGAPPVGPRPVQTVPTTAAPIP